MTFYFNNTSQSSDSNETKMALQKKNIEFCLIKQQKDIQLQYSGICIPDKEIWVISQFAP